MKLIYRSDGSIYFLATKAVKEGTALTYKELEELELSYGSKDVDEEYWQNFFWDADEAQN